MDTHKYTEKEQAEILWLKLGDVPVDDDGDIEEEFLFFDIGDDREEIWLWLEETYHVSIAQDLQYNNLLKKYPNYEEIQISPK